VEDKDLKDIDASLRGDDDAYERLVRRYQGQISRLMWRFTRDAGEAERLVQDVFVEAYFSLKNYRGQGSFASWLTTIATRTGYKFWKEKKKQRQRFDFREKDATESQSTEAPDASEAAEILYGLLEELKPSQRLVLTLMYFDGLDTEQIAARTGRSRAAVKMQAMRARRKLAKIARKKNIQEKLGWIE
jgi:RNA polymerase sigma-70 factor (ECF subfamily)